MKPLKTKAEIRQDIDNQVDAYLHRGGAVSEVARGISGREPTTTPPLPLSFDKQQQDRTPVPEVVAAIEERRHSKPDKAVAKRAKKPTRKLIYDDFGQPLRWQWTEE